MSSPLSNVSILLYNVYNLPSVCTDGMSRPRAKQISKFLADYDVIILNEAFINKDALLADVKDTHHDILTLGRKWYKIFDSGVIIISKFPITKSAIEHYDMNSGFDAFASKGIVFVRLQISEHKTLDVYGTHMQAGAAKSHQIARASQSAQLTSFILDHSPPSEKNSVVLAGDLNMGPVFDPKFDRFSVHYVDRTDAIARHNSYVYLRDNSKLIDLFAGRRSDDICRFLIRDMPYLPKLTYVDWATRELSDTEAIECRFEWPH